MQKQQIIIVFGALILLFGLYLLGPTVGPNKKNVASTDAAAADEHAFNIEAFKTAMIAELSTERQQYLSTLEANVKRGDVKNQEHSLNHALAGFWKDSVPNPILHYYYGAKLAELDNNEKSLTFAAHSILGYLPNERNHELQHWLADRGKQLFDKALLINPSNDSSIVGQGGCIIYGAHDAEAASPMEGILKVRAVAERDSSNLFAQYMLGVGGLISGQFDKAAARFEKVATAQPNNIEVLFKTAESYEKANMNEKAAEWYTKINDLVNIPELNAKLKERIEALKKGE